MLKVPVYLFGYDYVVLAAIYWTKCATTRHQSPAATNFAVVAAYSTINFGSV